MLSGPQGQAVRTPQVPDSQLRQAFPWPRRALPDLPVFPAPLPNVCLFVLLPQRRGLCIQLSGCGELQIARTVAVGGSCQEVGRASQGPSLALAGSLTEPARMEANPLVQIMAFIFQFVHA